MKGQPAKRILQLSIPSLLTIFLACFTPETAGVLSHLASPTTVVMAGYRVRLPITWALEWHTEEGVSAMTAPGIGRIGIGKYWRREVPLSEMGFWPVQNPEGNLSKNVPLEDVTVLAKRSFHLSSEAFNCWDLIEHNPWVGPHPDNASFALIKCSSESEHFYAYFDGWRGDAEAFYQTIEHIQVLN